MEQPITDDTIPPPLPLASDDNDEIESGSELPVKPPKGGVKLSWRKSVPADVLTKRLDANILQYGAPRIIRLGLVLLIAFDDEEVDWSRPSITVHRGVTRAPVVFFDGVRQCRLPAGSAVSFNLYPHCDLMHLTIPAGTRLEDSHWVLAPTEMMLLIDLELDVTGHVWRVRGLIAQSHLSVDDEDRLRWHAHCLPRDCSCLYNVPVAGHPGSFQYQCWQCISVRREPDLDYSPFAPQLGFALPSGDRSAELTQLFFNM